MLVIHDGFKKPFFESWLNLRALLYSIEGLPLPLLDEALTGKSRCKPSEAQIKQLLESAKGLLNEDAEDVSRGIYPIKCILPKESGFQHLKKLLTIFTDGVGTSVRRKRGQAKGFGKGIQKELARYPEYYRRNFHHQTDGYLSERSAYLYEHQVEMLFRGLADPMRRRLLKPMRKALSPSRESLKILEIGSGSGSFTRLLQQSFPKAHITALDISPYYSSFAKKRFISDSNTDFVVGIAEDLPYKDESFDAVVSVFLAHELPEKTRSGYIAESHRVCKKDGFWGMLDSIQLGDRKEFDWALQQFPLVFHEPFYKNYISKPLKSTILKEIPGIELRETCHHMAKTVVRV